MFISTAWAQAEGAGGGSGFDMIGGFMPIILIFGVFYFLLIRPQQKKMKVHKESVASVRRGDRVTTGGGIVGLVTKVDDDKDEVVVEIAEGMRVRVVRSTLMDVRGRGEPAKSQKTVKK